MLKCSLSRLEQIGRPSYLLYHKRIIFSLKAVPMLTGPKSQRRKGGGYGRNTHEIEACTQVRNSSHASSRFQNSEAYGYWQVELYCR